MKKFYCILAFSLLALNGICGTFTKTADHCYDYTGDIESSDVDQLTQLSKDNKSLTITINSYGGEYEAGLDLGRFTNSHGIKIVVDVARSAAGLWALGDRHVKYLTKASNILLHLPYTLSDEPTSSPELWMIDGALLQIYCTDVIGWSKEKSLFILHEMTELREKYGINAGIEIDADGQIYEVYPKPTKKLPAITVPPIAFFLYIYQP